MSKLNMDDLRRRLEHVSTEMISLIRNYGLDASEPLDIIPQARSRIGDRDDYIRFLELSLEGRIIGEAAERIQAEESSQS